MAVRFPSVGLQVLSSLIYFLGLPILTHCLFRSIQIEGLTFWASLKAASWPRICVELVCLDSWFFLFASGILIFGVGLETAEGACTTGVLICVIFYASSKMLIYCFLAEKVHLVWSAGKRRLRSPVYLACLVSITAYSVVVVLMIIGRVHYWRDDGICVIGLKSYSSIPLLSFDLYINLFLNGLFLWPLFRSRIINPRVRSTAIRTLIASAVALTTSLINIGILTVERGQQLGWVCLGSCGVDVILNALAVFWVTNGAQGSSNRSNDFEAPGEPIPHSHESQRIPMSSMRSDAISPKPTALSTQPQSPSDGRPVSVSLVTPSNDVENSSLASTLTLDSERKQQPFPVRLLSSRNAPRALEVLVTRQYEIDSKEDDIQPQS